VELRFVSPDLASLDGLASEILACPVWSDERPSHGVAGLCDFRLAGRVSGLQRRSTMTGQLGEVVMLPGKPRLTYDKLLFFGAGPRASFGVGTFEAVIARMLATLEGLQARSAVVELPGRHDELIAAEQAAELLLMSAGGSPEHDVWTLVEGYDARQRITLHLIEQRRRIRRIL
jgi:hypothetical protein